MSTEKPISFSAVLLNYNHSGFVLNPLDTAIRQTRAFDEIIVIDDASTDNSIALLREHIRDVPHARLIQNPQNLGVIASANLGLQQARGDFVFFMSADDNYSLHLVEWCHAALKGNPQVGMISGSTRICDIRNGKERIFALPFSPGCYGRADIAVMSKYRAFTFNIGANVIRREAAIAAGQHIAALKWHCDWFMYLLIAVRAPFAVLSDEFARIRLSDGQYSNACFHWAKQRPVIEAFIFTLKKDFPDEYTFFRQCALLPTYDIETLFLLITNPTLRDYLTPLLCWRLLTYKLLRLLNRFCPANARAMMRRLVRV